MPPQSIPAPVPPPAVVDGHLVGAPSEAGGDDDDTSEGDPESSSSSSSEGDPPPEDDPPPVDDPPPEDGPPPPAAPGPPPSKCDASTITEPVPPHTLPLGTTPVGSAPQSDLPPLDATQAALPEAPAGSPLRPMQAAAPLPREELAAVAATEAAEAAKRPAIAALVSPPQLAEERVLGQLLQLTRDIRRPRQYVGYSGFLCFCLSRKCRG